jgi:hypothetical protein
VFFPYIPEDSGLPATGIKESQSSSKTAGFSNQVIASEGCIEVRGYRAIPFAPEARETVVVNHKRWNFRDGSDIRIKCRAATA